MSITFYPNYIHYKGFDASAEPSITGQNYASSGGETTGAAYDLVDSKRDNLITLDTNGEGTDFTVDYDLTSNITSADFCIIDNQNFSTAACDVKLTYSGGSDITDAGVYSGTLGTGTQLRTIEYDSNWLLSSTIAGDEIILMKFDSQTENNWEVNGRDTGGTNFEADVTIGEIFVGKEFATSFQPEIGLIKSSDWGVDVLQSKGGQRYGFKKYGERKAWKLNWIYITDAEKTNFETLWTVTEGRRYPFYIDLGENANPTLYFVRFAMNDLVFTEVPGAWKVSIVLEEEI